MKILSFILLAFLVIEHHHCYFVKNNTNYQVNYHLRNPSKHWRKNTEELETIQMVHQRRGHIVIVGKDDIEKTQLVRQYAKEASRRKYNVLWINSLEFITLLYDFGKIAKLIGVKQKQRNFPLVQSVFNYFQRQKTLMIFDRASPELPLVSELDGFVDKNGFISVIIISTYKNWDLEKYYVFDLDAILKDNDLILQAYYNNLDNFIHDYKYNRKRGEHKFWPNGEGKAAG